MLLEQHLFELQLGQILLEQLLFELRLEQILLEQLLFELRLEQVLREQILLEQVLLLEQVCFFVSSGYFFSHVSWHHISFEGVLSEPFLSLANPHPASPNRSSSNVRFKERTPVET